MNKEGRYRNGGIAGFYNYIGYPIYKCIMAILALLIIFAHLEQTMHFTAYLPTKSPVSISLCSRAEGEGYVKFSASLFLSVVICIVL